jgi:CHAT domain-containing protein
VPELAGRHADQWMSLSRSWDERIREVRALPGFTDFLTAPRFEALAQAAEDGPVVLLNAAPDRCDAIIVHPDRAEPVDLGGLTIDTVADNTRRYQRTIWKYQEARQALALTRRAVAEGDASFAAYRAHDQARAAVVAQKASMEPTLNEILEWMWSAIAAPVLRALGFTGRTPQSPKRLWWCPTGIMTFLPLHAAGVHTGTDEQTVLDTAVSSYTPSLRALLAARTRPAGNLGTDELLLVSVPDAPDTPPLPKVDEEAAALRDLLGGRCTLRGGETATRREILRALTVHRFAHFSCHGLESPLDPRHAGIVMHDGLLSVRDIAAVRFSGEFAFLSACKTAVGVARLPDEAMSLAAALHYTGFRHVVATQWSVYDSIASDVARLFYREAIVDGGLVPDRFAIALHRALTAIRDTHRARPSTWIPYVHQGP